ncbi:MAG: GcvT family protein [Gammaproteobacteria bacterium]|nr:GcvT family protein [Gammaproteobacteria bacterium]
MSLPSSARVVIIGGGAVGASALYHLALKGWTDCVLLEKNELTSGSTWHAAGNVPTFSSSWGIMNMQRYSAELYRELGERVDYPMNYHVTGSVRLAHSDERMQEFAKVLGMGQHQGMSMKLLDLDELKELYPFVETHDLKGALYDPNDGDIDPAQLTQALAKGARDLGAKIVRFCPVQGAEWTGTHWKLSTEQGEILAEYVVNAAGYRAQEVGAMFGRKVPMMTMAHQYVLTEQIPALEEWSKTQGKKLPLLRDVDSSYYLRQEKHGFNLGPYERNCKGHWMDPSDPMPEDFSFQLWDEDIDRIAWQVEDAMARVPLLGEGGVNRIVNGPIPYTPDGNPLIGPMPGVPNAFDACVFTFGIAQGGGAGKVLAEWIVDGGTEQDMWCVDPRRFTGFEDQDYCNQKGMEVYGHEYAMHFPHHEWPAGRDKKHSPAHAQVLEQGAVLGAYNGWERANWFAKPGDDTSEEATQIWKRNGPWAPRIAEECAAVRDTVGILDLPGFSRFRVSGANARQALDELFASRIPAPGRIGLVYLADHRGRIVTEMTVMCISDELFFLITAATAELHDYDHLSKHLANYDGIDCENVTEQFSCQIVTGPNSRALFSDLCDADLSLPWLSHQSTQIDGHHVQLVRMSFAGELGWEVHSKTEDTAAVYAAILAAGQAHGIKPFGMYALNSLRIEKGYRAWKGDLSTDYTLLESGLSPFVSFKKDAQYPGRAALEAEKAAGSTKQLVSLIVDSPEFDPPYMASVYDGDTLIGECTSAAWGHRVDACVALATLKTSAIEAGKTVKVQVFGNLCDAVIQPNLAVWDADNARIKA